MTDWIGDPELSREEKLERFRALSPTPANQNKPMPCVTASTRADLTLTTARLLTLSLTRSTNIEMPGAVPSAPRNIPANA